MVKRGIPLFLLCAFAAMPLRAEASGVMPVLHVESLSGKQLVLPSDLPKGPCLFIVGFSKASRSQTEGWSRRLSSVFRSGELTIYSVSVVEDVPRLLRPLVVGGIRSSVPGTLHERFLVASKQSLEWKKMTSYTEPDIAHVVLVNTDHQPIWRTKGPANDHGIQELAKHVESESRRVPAQQSVPASAK